MALEAPPPFDRATGIGGSDVGAILGLSPHRSEWDVWLEKTRDPAWRPKVQTSAMRLGQLLEPVVAQLYEMTKVPRTIVRLHPEADRTVWHPNGILYAHIDGDADEVDFSGAFAETTSRGIFESKVPRNSRDWASGPPPGYEAQARTYLACYPKAQWLDMVALFRDTAEHEIYRIERNSVIEDKLVRRVEDWWDRRVVRGEPPPMDASAGASAYLATRYYEPTRDEIFTGDSQFEAAAASYLDMKAMIKRNEETVGRLRSVMISAMGEYPRAEGPGWHIIFKRTKGSKTVAWKEVALALRKLIEEARREPTKVSSIRQLAALDLDAIESMYTTENDGNRPFIVTAEKEQTE